MLLLCSLGTHAPSGAVEPAMVRTLIFRLFLAYEKPPRGALGCTGEAHLPLTAPARAALEQVLRPALRATAFSSSPFPVGSANPSYAAQLHDLLAEFLLYALPKRAVEPAHALEVVREALGGLALPMGGSSSAFVTATLAAWPTLPRLLETGALQPIALAWTAPTFEKARRSYVSLISRHFPELDWVAQVGLNPEVLTQGIAGSFSAGEGSQRGDHLTVSEGASDAGGP